MDILPLFLWGWDAERSSSKNSHTGPQDICLVTELKARHNYFGENVADALIFGLSDQ